MDRGYLHIAHKMISAATRLLDGPAAREPVMPPAWKTICQRVRELEDPATPLHGMSDPSIPEALKQASLHKLFQNLQHLMTAGHYALAEQTAQEMRKHSGAEEIVPALMGYSYYLHGQLPQAAQWIGQVRSWTGIPVPYAMGCALYLLETRAMGPAQLIVQTFSPPCAQDPPASQLFLLLLEALMAPSARLDTTRVSELLRASQPKPGTVPVIVQRLSSFALPLLRRVEAPHPDPLDVHAAGIVAEALWTEHEATPYHEGYALTLARALIVSGQARKAWTLLVDHPHAPSGAAYFSLFAWMKGEEILAQKGLRQLDLSIPAPPAQQFARWVACAVNGDAQRALTCAEALFQQAPDYFVASAGETTWGMLALALKAAGQIELAEKAQALANRTDRFAACRAHLLGRVPAPPQTLSIPGFQWPSCFV